MRTVIVSMVVLSAGGASGEVKVLVEPYGGVPHSKPKVEAYAEVEFPTASDHEPRRVEKVPLKGRTTYYTAKRPKERSALEVMENYDQALRKAGFQILYRCNQKCPRFNTTPAGYLGPDHFYLTARRTGSEGTVWAALLTGSDTTTFFLLEENAMETGKVKVTAAALASGIQREGHVAIYEIFFDTDRADVKTESTPTLDEIAKLLGENPSMKLWVVGHTDAQGALAHNMDLSKRRAESVVKILTAKYKVAAARIGPSGVGPLAPVATNKTDEGRAKNRRVELVEQ